MFFIGTDIQAGVLFVSIFLIMLIGGKWFRSGVPRLRVVFLSGFCLFVWICSFSLTLLDKTAAQSLLWEMMSFLGMVSTVFMFFIAAYEIIATPWM